MVAQSSSLRARDGIYISQHSSKVAVAMQSETSSERSSSVKKSRISESASHLVELTWIILLGHTVGFAA